MPGFPVLHHLLEFAQMHAHQVGDVIQPSHPLLPPSLPSLNLSQQQSFPKSQLFASGGLCISMSPSNEYSGLISFRIDWFDLLPVQGTLQHHSLRASVLWCSAFFMVQLSHLYMTTGKTIALTPQTFVGKAMSLCVLLLFFFLTL